MIQQQDSRKSVSPKTSDLLFHFIKTVELVWALLSDRRIGFKHKAFFVGAIGALLVILIFPEVIGEAFLIKVLPVAEAILGMPLAAGLDWAALSSLIVNLLRFFPAEIVAEHYERIFKA